MKRLNFKAYLYILFFRLKGFKIYLENNNVFLIDKKRVILIAKRNLTLDNYKFTFKNKSIQLKNPYKSGFFLIKNYNSPYLCILFT